MTKIERRRAVILLHQGNYEQELADLLDEMMAAQRAEESGGPLRAGQKSKAMALAEQYDAKVAEAETTATRVTVWALLYDAMEGLEREHKPRENDATDEGFGVNMETFPRALLEASLVAPDEAADLDELKSKGHANLVALGVSRVQYRKLEHAAWKVNVGDDDIPKESLVWLLTRAKESDSRQQPGSE